MASSETWREFWLLRDDYAVYREIAQAAELAIDCWNPHMGIWTPIIDGPRHVPYCLCTNFSQNRKPWPDFDLRNHPFWKEAQAFFPEMFAEQCNNIRPGSMEMVGGTFQFVLPMVGPELSEGLPATYPSTVNFTGYRALLELTNAYRDFHNTNPFVVQPTFITNRKPQWFADMEAAGVARDPKFRAWWYSYGYGPLLPYPTEEDYWTQTELEEQYESLAHYRSCIKEALSWWLVLHNLSPGSYIDFAGDLEIVIERINMAEQGDPLAIAMLESSGVPAGDPDPASESPYTEGVVLYNVGDFAPPGGAGSLTQGDFFDRYKSYWPYAAAAGVVGAAMLMRKGKGV